LRRLGTLPNVWWGVSVEDREHGLPRIDLLRRTNAAVRFLSVEPCWKAWANSIYPESIGSSWAAKAACARA
jgi:protein gp37